MRFMQAMDFHRLTIFVVAVAGLLSQRIDAQVNLSPGDIAVIGWSDNVTADPFQIVTLTPIAAGTVLYFTDNGWTGTGYRGVTAAVADGTEDLCRLTFNAAVPAGQIIRAYTNSASWTWKISGAIDSGGAAAGNYNEINVNEPGDQIYVVQSTSTTNPLFVGTSALYVFDDTDGFENATSGQTGNIPPGLSIEADTAVTIAFAPSISLHFEINTFEAATREQWLNAMADPANWDGTPLPAFITSIQVIPDADKDGVADADDLCPSTPLGDTTMADGCSCSESAACIAAIEACEAAKMTQMPQREDGFLGQSVAIDGDYAVVGSSRENPNSEIFDLGGARIYERSTNAFGTGGWVLKATLEVDDPADFGRSVAISGERVAVGVPKLPQGGQVRVYKRTGGGAWNLEDTVAPNNPDGTSLFGQSVALDGDTLVVGAPHEDGPENTFSRGAAWVFTRSGSNWTQQKKLVASDFAQGDQFGTSVGIDGDMAIIGAPYAGNSPGTGDPGAVYVFTRNGTTWTEDQVFTAPDAEGDDAFGAAVGLSIESGDQWVIVGAPGHGVGAAYLFDRIASMWVYAQTMQPALPFASPFLNPNFGASVAIESNRALVGAPGLGDEDLNDGSAMLLVRDGDEWFAKPALRSAGGGEDDEFGAAVVLSGNTLLIGAPFHDLNKPDTGAAYFFSIADCNANGVSDACDIVDGTSDDLDGDGFPDECCDDGDRDGVCDRIDLCPGSDDAIDADNDTVPDGCDECPGFDDVIDIDGDGIADGCDPCIDPDNDGVCDPDDQCPGFDDALDADGDGVPDGCDQCAGGGTVTFYFNLADWQAAAGDIVTFTTIPSNVVLAEEVARPPGSNAQLGGVLTFLDTPLEQQFRVKCLEPGAGFTFADTEGTAGFLNALSVGDINNFENDDWEFEFLSGPEVFAFGVDCNDFGLEPGESFSVYCEGLGLISATFDGPSGVFGFFGVVSDVPIRKVVYDEAATGDDTAIANFRWTSRPVRPPACPPDLNGDNSVDGADLGLLLGNWSNPGEGDIDGSGSVDGADLGLLLGAWGPCP